MVEVAAAVVSQSSLLAAGALLATFVAGLFARSILEHEFDLWQRMRLGQEVARANRAAVTRPIEPVVPSLYSELAEPADEVAARSYADGAETQVVWPTRS